MKRLETNEARGALRTPPWRRGPRSLSCVVPAFNEARGLAEFLRDLHRVASRHCSEVEIIVVDDGSDDETPFIAASLARPLGLRYVQFSRNFGKEAAITAGLDRARGEAVLIIDADYQHPLGALPDMLEQWRRGFDVVYGVRRDRAGEGVIKRIGAKLFYDVLAVDAPVPIPPAAGDFRLLDRKVVAALKQMHERNRFMKGLYAWVGFNSVAVTFEVGERRHGVSRFSVRKLLRLGFAGITAFTDLPLRVWSGFGMLISCSALAYGGWVVVQTLIEGNDVPGWPTIVAGLMFFSGLQLISIGIVGEYLGRVFDEVKQRPVYIVREEIDCSALARRGRPALAHKACDSELPQTS